MTLTTGQATAKNFQKVKKKSHSWGNICSVVD